MTAALVKKWDGVAKASFEKRAKLIASGQHAHVAEEVLMERGGAYRDCANALRNL